MLPAFAPSDFAYQEKFSVPGSVRIGIAGWTYPPWRGVFYPKKLVQKNELAFASRAFRSIEINGTFYSLQRPENFANWSDATPDDFVFAVKGPQFITHIKRLGDVRAPLANFFASGLLRLGKKFGPILWQLPPNFKFDAKKIDTFFKMLPHDTKAAVALAKRHDRRVNGRSWLKTDEERPIRHAMEIRNASFAVPEFIELLREHDVALVCGDGVEWPRLMDVTSDFIYCRLHGSEEIYANGYDAKSLDAWAARVAAWARGSEPEDAERVIAKSGQKLKARDVFIFFDNDMKVRAPVDAHGLVERVDQLLEKS
jgi:uncharacterized protein YecE (DUF72 family)